MTVTPTPGLASVVTAGGTPVNAIGPMPNGGFITNPASASDQGLGAAENLYIDPVGAAGLNGNGTTFVLAPGQTWTVIPGQSTPTSVNAASSGHKFSVVVW
jgi:hypothetical protein